MNTPVKTFLSLTVAIMLSAATAGADPNPNNNGNQYGLFNGNGPPWRGTVPLPGTLLLFGAGWAAFAGWNWARTRHENGSREGT